MPNIACGNTWLAEIGISTMSSTTPTRKSMRMKTQASSAKPRMTAFSSATATADPSNAPIRTIPAGPVIQRGTLEEAVAIVVGPEERRFPVNKAGIRAAD